MNRGHGINSGRYAKSATYTPRHDTFGPPPTLIVSGAADMERTGEYGAGPGRDLTGIDLTTPEGIEQLMNSNVPMTVCFPAVALAYRLAVDLLKETS